MARVSVIIAAYNGEKYISETLNSILNQTLKDIEIIVVDDGSTDKTARTVKLIQDPRVTYIYQNHVGYPAGPKNAGIAVAKGEFIGFCDQDDLYYPEKLEKQLIAYAECNQKESIGVINTSADIINDAGHIIGKNIKPFSGFISSQTANGLLLKGNFITACSVLVPKNILAEVGNLDETLKGVDDYDLWIRITDKYGVLTMQESLCAWRQHDDSLSANKTKQYLETEKIFDKLISSKRVKIGHGRNLTRIFLSYLLNKDYAEAKKYRNKTINYPASKKIYFLMKLFDISPSLSYLLIKFLQKIGRVSL